MGVPALFRWLSKKYPKIISPVIEELPRDVENADGSKTSIPVDACKPNPNGEEMDNLYLDMNGIVHPCSHPEDRPAPANEEEMMVAIFEYTDRVVKMVRPRKLLMIAVDGVAPRAKMNQQRSRRFRSAQEAAEKDKAAEEYLASLRASGELGRDEGSINSKAAKTWDSNSITPGTPFMDLLAASLRYWVRYKSTTDPAWAKLKIIISDATVPGEGEHKIMNFVRSQRSSPTHDPNLRHVIYGLDADLIMLGIATHEPHFRVLREDVFANDTKPGHCRKCNQPGHMADQCLGAIKAKPGDEVVEKPLKPFIWLHVGVLREYLAVEMNVPDQPFPFNLELALDDWVFMCFFVGNDFLPHLPSLDIREDGIDTLIAIWRDNIPTMGGYVTKDGQVNMARAQAILEGLAKQEEAIFRRRRETELAREEKARRRNYHQNPHKRTHLSLGAPTGFDETVIRRGARGGIVKGEAAPDINALPTFAPGDAQTRKDPRYASSGLTHADVVGNTQSIEQANADNKAAAAALRERLKQSKKVSDNQQAAVNDLMGGLNGDDAPAPVLGKRTREMIDDSVDEPGSDPSTPGRETPNSEVTNNHKGTSGALGGNSDGKLNVEPEDTVKLWEEGCEDRYYEQKFHVAPSDIEFRHKVGRAYTEGLCWVLLYYFQGCSSWTWYYPYHYAPFAADFVKLDQMDIQFHKGKPFRPYEQLMGVMPAASNHTIPGVFHSLMTDDDSPIKEFYPEDFDVDLNGKKFAWQGVALLPFIDEKRLLDAMATKYPLLTEEESRRNGYGEEALIFSTKHPLYEEVASNFYSKRTGAAKVKMNPRMSEGLTGKMSKDESFVPNSGLVFPLDTNSQEDFTSLDEDESVTVSYHMPPISGLHKSMLLPGVEFDTPMLDYNDVQTIRNRSLKTGRSYGGVQLSYHGDRSDGRPVHYARDRNHNVRGRSNGSYYSDPASNSYNGSYGGHAAQQNANGNNPFANLPPHLAQQAAAHGFAARQMPPNPGYPPPATGHPAAGQYRDQHPASYNGRGGYQGGQGHRDGYGNGRRH